MAFKASLQISREKLEFIYSVFLIIAIPLLLVLNSFVLLSTTKSNFDTELRRKADMANAVFGVIAAEHHADTAQLQSLAEQVQAASEEIDEVTVLAPVGDKFAILATTGPGLGAEPVEDVQAALVVARSASIASLVYDEASQSRRAWRVLSPITQAGETVAIASMNVSLDRADALLRTTALRSMAILVVTIAAIILLLLNHFKFVEYAVLFQKQKELDRLKDDFLQVATHELKAPMSVIKGNLSLILDGDSGKVSSSVKEKLEVAVTQTESLNRLVSDLLNVSRLEQGRIKFELQSLDIGSLLESLVAELQPRAAEKGLELKYQKEAQLPQLSLDPDRTKEIFTNLIDNAIKYSQTGEIRIYHQLEKNTLLTTVEDQGIGMSAKDRERLFSRFYRIRNQATEGIGGTGLGLWIVKQYVVEMGGTIFVDSLEDKGSRFTVEFPLSKKVRGDN